MPLRQDPPRPLPPTARVPLALVTVLTLSVLRSLSDGYGYHRDELYFRMLGFHPAWGYTDQPPLTPLLARLSVFAFGDTVEGMHFLPAFLTFATCWLTAQLARELGGGAWAQTLAATAGFGAVTLTAGHVLLTMSADLPLWLLVELFVLRALLREEPRWWLWAGLVTGLALYNKLLVVLLLAGLGVGLAAVGPRSALRSRYLWAGAGIAVVVGAPNLIYQVVEGFPQADMAAALAQNKGDEARVLLVPMQLLAMGPLLAPVWVAGLVGLLRRAAWRPVRALAIGYLAICLFLFVQGGQFSYLLGLLHLFFAAGWVLVERWLTDGARARRATVVVVVAVSAAAGVVISLPFLPVDRVGRTPIPAINQAARDSVGWPTYVDQVAAVHATLPDAVRGTSVVITGNYGEAGAVDRYGPALGLPRAYSGQNALYALGPPPESATAIVAVMQDDAALGWLRGLFDECRVGGRLDNGVGVDNEEQGAAVLACTGRREPWARIWPQFAHLD